MVGGSWNMGSCYGAAWLKLKPGTWNLESGTMWALALAVFQHLTARALWRNGHESLSILSMRMIWAVLLPLVFAAEKRLASSLHDCCC